ncbi:hypothetical protein CO683_22950 [Bradyrhizobium ottawaense]|nr:hypothetical protein CO683_22950 [Bradyrhizobium ottawaense]
MSTIRRFEQFQRYWTPLSPPSCPGLSRASTPLLLRECKDVDGQDKPGHDDCRRPVVLRRAAKPPPPPESAAPSPT